MTWRDGYTGTGSVGAAVWVCDAGWCWETWGRGWRTSGGPVSFAAAIEGAQRDLRERGVE